MVALPPMRQKASMSSSDLPIIVAYKRATKQIIGKWINVAKKHYERMRQLQHRLDEADVEYDEYATSVINAWWGWCKSKRMYCVPATMFCGDKAWSRFMDQRQSSIRIDTKRTSEDAYRLYDNYMSAIRYIDAYMYGNRPVPCRIDDEVLSLLRSAYNCPDAVTYKEIAIAIDNKH